jgi:hypothetical protein
MVRAHHDCFIANSVSAEIAVEPEIIDAGAPSPDGQPSPTSRR